MINLIEGIKSQIDVTMHVNELKSLIAYPKPNQTTSHHFRCHMKWKIHSWFTQFPYPDYTVIMITNSLRKLNLTQKAATETASRAAAAEKPKSTVRTTEMQKQCHSLRPSMYSFLQRDNPKNWHQFHQVNVWMCVRAFTKYIGSSATLTDGWLVGWLALPSYS